mmetsp:Transcript_18185/g.25630  ORF Transcript_18185/g.25630 Transcript_18185/m.25630 type:complete len:295 (+) Transcript_18185:195-1079(+)
MIKGFLLLSFSAAALAFRGPSAFSQKHFASAKRDFVLFTGITNDSAGMVQIFGKRSTDWVEDEFIENSSKRTKTDIISTSNVSEDEDSWTKATRHLLENGTCKTDNHNLFFNFGPVGASIVLVWRGVWDLQDTYVYPEDTVLSATLSVVFGVIVGALCQTSSRESKKSYQTEGLKSMYFDVLFTLCASIACISYWRGVWLLWDQCVFPSNPTIQHLLGLVLGSVILFIFGQFKVGVPGPPIFFPPVDADGWLHIEVDNDEQSEDLYVEMTGLNGDSRHGASVDLPLSQEETKEI